MQIHIIENEQTARFRLDSQIIYLTFRAGSEDECYLKNLVNMEISRFAVFASCVPDPEIIFKIFAVLP